MAVFDPMREWNCASVAFRLILAMIAGGIVGLERGRKHRAAGFRTHMLVCAGAALSMLMGQYQVVMADTVYAATAALPELRLDAARFGAQVINGIGFLAAGTIILTGRQEVKGLTTAAGLWASACMGLAVGAGFYECVVIALLAMILVVRLLPAVEAFLLVKARNINLYMEFETLADVGRIIACFKEQEARIYEIEIDQHNSWENSRSGAFFSIRLKERQAHTELLLKLSELDCVYLIEEL